ncbi:MAG: hypothetical protein ACOH1I_05410 [Gallionellaceae bacterium]|jgi:hypothetical protein
MAIVGFGDRFGLGGQYIACSFRICFSACKIALGSLFYNYLLAGFLAIFGI